MAERSPALKALDAEIKERVLRGIDFLKETYGDDWVDHINLNRLELREGDVCVLGQVHPAYHGEEHEFGYDGYSAALEQFNIEDDSALGFCSPDLDELKSGEALSAEMDADEGFLVREKVWDSMNRVWKQEIRKILRRKERE